MKVTIDIPAPSQLLELVSRLRSKNRNYKTQLKQLGKAHFITKKLYELSGVREETYRERISNLQDENERLRNELAYLMARTSDAIGGCMTRMGYIGADIAKVDAEVTFDHPI